MIEGGLELKMLSMRTDGSHRKEQILQQKGDEGGREARFDGGVVAII